MSLDIGIKVENEGKNSQGRLSAEEFNRLVAAVVDLDKQVSGAIGVEGIRDKLVTMNKNVERLGDDVALKIDKIFIEGTDLYAEADGQIVIGPLSLNGGQQSVQRHVRVMNELDSKNISASKGEPCELKFKFISQERYSSQDPYENTGERGLCQVYVKNTDGSDYVIVKEMYVNSDTIVTVNIAEFLTSGANNVMVKVTGEVTEVTTPAFVYTVQLTSLSIAANNFRWWTAFTGDVTMPFNIGGNVSKVLHVTVTGKGYNHTADMQLGTAVYTETAYNYQIMHPGVTGVFKISAYLSTLDGTIRTRTISYNIICAVIGEPAKLIAINNVLEKATNWTENTLFDYAMYDGDKVTTSARFIVKKDGNAIFTSDEDCISTSAKYTFSLPMEIDTLNNSEFEIITFVVDGETNLTEPVTIPVDNSLGYSASAGAVFYMNPRTRSNNQNNYLSIINEMTANTVSATWKGMNWGYDGWTTDAEGNKVLRVMASASVDIGYKPFIKEAARVGKAIEIDYKVDNVTDSNHPVITISSDSDAFVGLKVFPDNVVMFSNALKNLDNQSINLFEGKRLHLTLVIMPDAYGNSGFNLCIIYVNGVKNREFTYENNDYFAHDKDIVIGSDYADVDVYGIRVYDSALTSEAVLRNYINWLVGNTEKSQLQKDNDVLDGNGSEIDFENTKDQFNVFVFNNSFPSLDNPNKMTGVLDVFYAGHPEWNTSISNIEAKGQGTSSMRYWKWNIRFTIDKKASIVTTADGSTSIGGWAMTPGLAKATKITAKKNFASSMQSHKIGSVNSVDDLYRAMGYLNEAMQTEKYANARVAVSQLPFVAFEKSINEEGEAVYTFRGLYTMGPDKGDKNTFGHDTDLFPGLLSIEGSDNSPLCTLFRVPWSARMQYNEEEEAFQYNGANCWDFGAGEIANINKWIPAYNLAYQCSNRLKPFNGTLEELNAQVATYRNEPYEFWIAKAGDKDLYNVYYYESSEGKFIASDIGEGGINLKTQLSDYLAADLSSFTIDQLNELFIAARIKKFRAESSSYWDIDDAILHRNWVEYHAGTDNRAKNTYPYCFGNDGSKWRWRYDDLDTIFDTDNQGQAKKGYYVEFHDRYDTGGSVWNGETSNFWNLLDLSFPDEIWAGMRKMMTKMEELGGLKSGTDFDKLYAYFQKYYFSQAQDYFPQNLYNADAKFTYEGSKLAYIDGRYTNDTDPITQALGDHYSAEQRWITKRILYMMSKYSFGLFSSDGTDNITVRAAGDTIRYELTPAMDMYPAIANGTSIIRGERTKAGEVCNILIELSGSGDQQNTIQAASYLQDIGDWYNKNVTGSMIIQGRMLRDIRLGSKTEPINISITSLAISNCVSLQNLDLSRISTLTGTLNLTACNHLKKVYAGGTSLTQLSLPKGGGVETVEYSGLNQYLILQNYPLLKSEGVLLNYCKENITDFLIENCPQLKPMQLLSTIIEAQQSQGTGHALRHIRAVGFTEEYYTPDALDMLALLADGSYEGLSAEGIAGENEYPVLEGKITVHSNYYQESVDALRNIFNRLDLILDGISCIKFADLEVKRICVDNWDNNKDGDIDYIEAEAPFVLFQYFKENTKIESFDEFKYFKTIKIIYDSNFKDCTSLKRISLPESYTNIRYQDFSNTILEHIELPSTLKNISKSAFFNVLTLNEITIPESVETIADSAFDGAGLIRLIYPSNMMEIDGLVNNPCLTYVEIGENAVSVFGMGKCPVLETLIIRAITPPVTNYRTLSNVSGVLTIYVPDTSVTAYKESSGWKKWAASIKPLSQYKE